MLLIGSPMCTEFCTWTHINHKKMAAEVAKERLRKARAHSEFCTKLYALQIHHGRYVVHEHPLGASSWRDTCIERILGKHGVIKVKADQCQYGLLSRDIMGVGMVRKATGFMTNSPCVAMQLRKRCPNRSGKIQHKHVTLQGGRTKAAQIYPEGLCRAICVGLVQQLDMDKRGQFVLAQLHGTEQETQDVSRQIKEEFRTVEEEDTQIVEQAWDDVTGAELDPVMVKGARQEEVEYIKKMNLYVKVPITECWRNTSK